MDRPSKVRLDILMLDRGLAETRSKAQALIMAGSVLVNGEEAVKPGETIPCDSEISVKKTNPYVSRGGLKLESALQALSISVEGKVCMDVGSSTGGFTDCLLQHGATRVYAIDVGRNQLHYKLTKDPRVVLREGINFRYFSCESLKENIQFVTIDVSFISLDKILPVVVNCLREGGQVLAMVKPQFEASRQEVKKGVIRDESIRQRTIQKIKDIAVSLKFTVRGEADSAVIGPQGNREHFLWLEKTGS